MDDGGLSMDPLPCPPAPFPLFHQRKALTFASRRRNVRRPTRTQRRHRTGRRPQGFPRRSRAIRIPGRRLGRSPARQTPGDEEENPQGRGRLSRYFLLVPLILLHPPSPSHTNTPTNNPQVTKEEPTWESFSEDDLPLASASSKQKSSLPPSTASTAAKEKEKKKAGGKAGQGSIMSFFGKK